MQCHTYGGELWAYNIGLYMKKVMQSSSSICYFSQICFDHITQKGAAAAAAKASNLIAWEGKLLFCLEKRRRREEPIFLTYDDDVLKYS
jgi:hypothetical protein